MNPHNTTGNGSGDESEIIGLDAAKVTTSPSNKDGDNGTHAVEVQPEMMEQTIIADVRVDQIGDISIPTEGSNVTIAYRANGRPHVLGSRYAASDTVPNYEAGERVIGHPLSDAHIRLASDGTVHIEGDADVVINGGDTRPVTDVTTTTDGEGHVTDVSLSRASNVYLPSDGES